MTAQGLGVAERPAAFGTEFGISITEGPSMKEGPMSETIAPQRTVVPSLAETRRHSAPTQAAIRTVLFPSDLSPGSERALDHARFLALRFRARMTLYHVVEVSPRHGQGPSNREEETWRRAAKSAREHLDYRADGLRIPTAIVVEREASAGQALVAHIHRTLPDLTVMATHGRSGLAHLLVGSVTEMVVQQGRCPVLCVREPDHGVALPYRRILVPTDLSAGSRRAFPLAALLARAFEAEVLALHVVGVTAPRLLLGVSYAVEASPSEEAVRLFLDPDFRDVRVTPRVLLGSAWDQIVETARTERVDLIVMSTHGHDSLADRVVGSHAERVVRHAPCPVLLT
jgi:nucleotide-binding universal stress UspA family protein